MEHVPVFEKIENIARIMCVRRSSIRLKLNEKAGGIKSEVTYCELHVLTIQTYKNDFRLILRNQTKAMNMLRI